MVRNKAKFCLKAFIFKCLQILQVYWSKRSLSSPSIFVSDKKQTVSSDQLSLRLSELDPDATYYVQVTLIEISVNLQQLHCTQQF